MDLSERLLREQVKRERQMMKEEEQDRLDAADEAHRVEMARLDAEIAYWAKEAEKVRYVRSPDYIDVGRYRDSLSPKEKEELLYLSHSPRSKRRQRSMFPPRYEPYYVRGLGWYSDTRYVEKIGAGCFNIVLFGFLFLMVMAAFGSCTTALFGS